MVRPKLEEGDKGSYNVSRKEKAKRTLKKKISTQTKDRERLKVRAKKKTEQKRNAEKALNNIGLKKF